MAELMARREAYRATVVFRLGSAAGAVFTWMHTTVPTLDSDGVIRGYADKAGLQHSRADRVIRLGEPYALIDRACRMPDLQPEVPQQIEHELNNALSPCSLLEGHDEKKIDV